MAIRIGHASIDENGRIQGGRAGDNNKKELCIRGYYVHKKGWYVLRPKSVDVANKLASAMIDACTNNNIGYDQSNRLGIITNLKKYGRLKNIAVKTESDCSSTVRACCIEAGFDPGNFTTSNEASALEATGQFMDRVAVKSNTTLYNGDVLVTKTKGHTVIVVSGNPRKEVKSSGKIDTVAEVQTWLNKSYNANLKVDNDYGSNTKRALVKALQTELNNAYNAKLKVDGEYGSKTRSAVRTLKKGDNGALVKVLQALLVCNGYSGAYLDGDYGNGTYNAVKFYQTKKGLKVDGEAGKATFTALCK